MEFLNDFLEYEAPRMKSFLLEISSGPEAPIHDNILDWAGHIDQGKQLSILHTLLVENISKLPTNKQRELDPLITILEAITLAKETNCFSTSSQLMFSHTQYVHSNQENQNIPQTTNAKLTERGVIRGVLTPSSLEKNIFRYNDPTILPLLSQNQSTNSLQHSNSTSSISSNMNPIASSSIQHHMISSTNNERQPAGTRTFTSTSHYNSNNNGTSSLRKESRSPLINCSGLRASTLPRNNLNTIEPLCNNTNIIQIGFDRRSPAPLRKTPNSIEDHTQRIVHSSQLSLVNDIGKNPLSLGIPYNEYSTQNLKNNNPSNMPMSLEDLEDLFNYADEQNHENNYRNNTKEVLTSKGSNVSISNICSSGYQSIATQSQSSSPIDLAQNVDYLNKRKPGPNKYEFLNQKYTNNRTDNENNNFPVGQYKAPILNHITSNQTSNSKHTNVNYSNNLNSSSSEEYLSNHNNDYQKDSGEVSENFSRLQNKFGSARAPRTNPLIQVSPTKLNKNVSHI